MIRKNRLNKIYLWGFFLLVTISIIYFVLKALDKNIKVKELYNNLGIAYYATKDNIKAKTMFEHAIKLDSNYGHALDNLKNINNIQKYFNLPLT